MRLVLLLVLSALGPAVMLAAEQPAIDPAWVERVKIEGKAAYEKYAALALRLDESSETSFNKVGTRPGKMHNFTGIRRDRHVRLGDNIIREVARIPDDKGATPRFSVECDNPDYNFSLGKFAEDREHALRDYGLGPRKLPLVRQGGPAHDAAHSEIKNILDAIDGTGEHALAGLRFDAEKRLLVADLQFKNSNSDIKTTLMIDTAAGWRLVERRADTRHLTAVDKFTYGKVIEGVAMPDLVENESRYKSPDTLPDMSIIKRVLDVKITDKTPADFRLSGFGLPEPADAPPPPAPPRWHLWLLGCAAITAALAFGFAWLRRRYMAPPEGTT